MKIVSYIYLLGGLYAIIMAVGFLYEIIRKRKSFDCEYISKKSMIALWIILAVTPFYWYFQTFYDPNLSGSYNVTMNLRYSEESVKVDMDVSSDIDYDEYESWSGGYEHTVTETRFSYVVWVKGLTLPSGEYIKIGDELYEDDTLYLYRYVDEYYYDDYYYDEVNIWPLTKEKLDITNEDIIQKITIKKVCEPILSSISCAFLLVQYFYSEKKRREKHVR